MTGNERCVSSEISLSEHLFLYLLEDDEQDWLAETSWLNSQWFDQTTKTYSADSHQLVSLTASYTFSFGKKIRQGDDLQDAGASSSAIMK